MGGGIREFRHESSGCDLDTSRGGAGNRGPAAAKRSPWLLARLGNNRFRQFDAVSALTYSPDGKYLASADGETIHIWDASDGRRVRSIAIKDHTSDKLRAMRACEVLEGLGTPEVLTLLEAWARGAPGATLTREASESVQRIKVSNK